MKLKDIIEKMKSRKIFLKTKKDSWGIGVVDDRLYEIDLILPDLEKANELQKEMRMHLFLLVALFKDESITAKNAEKFLEKYYNKPWEEIIK